MENLGLPTPKTVIVHSENESEVPSKLGFPLVLKAPDSTFSFGVKKAKDLSEYEVLVKNMLQESDLIIAQEYCPSEYDWRVGILDSEVIYVCRYYMAKGHWQIYNWSAADKEEQDGMADAMAIEEVPSYIIKTALEASKIIGQGLLGVDLKEVNGKAIIIEVNDNPNIDFGVEDAFYGDLVYEKIIKALIKRLDAL